ncbi:MAG: hypothetical protein H6608_07870 [Flavobacteriales bacterium]|nr:hypothetical protein [Bacteroidota bacterium]MCB9241033.1 hypothetical protein [Flavobacteriales bacterium]
MIRLIHRGGIAALLLGLLLMVSGQGLMIVHGVSDLSTHLSWSFGGTPVQIPPALLVGLSYFILLMIGLMVNAFLNRFQFFEERTTWPFFFLMAFSLSTPGVFNQPGEMVFVLLLFLLYNRLFHLNEEEIGELQLYMDVGTLFGLAVLFYSPGLMMLPMIILVLNQFALLDFNRFLLFLLSVLIVVIPGWITAWYFISENWVLNQLNPYTHLHLDLTALLQPIVLYPVIVLFIGALVVYPVMNRELTFMQNHNRKIISTLFLQFLFGLIIAVLMGEAVAQHLAVSTIALVALLAFGVGWIRNQWMGLIYLILFVFAWNLIFWEYL